MPYKEGVWWWMRRHMERQVQRAAPFPNASPWETVTRLSSRCDKAAIVAEGFYDRIRLLSVKEKL